MPADFTPYVPRLVAEWQRDAPDERWRTLDGTLLFIDLSGFTAMSERLAVLARQGAEEVANIIDATFSELLALASSVEGMLLKFGGDALLLFFTGPTHAQRACFAAHEMRAKLRTIGRIQTPVGTVRLRMSAGMHTGPFDFFLVGRSHQELIVAGDSATTTVLMEQEATAGEILVSAASAASLGQAFIGERKGQGFLLRRAPATSSADPGAVADWSAVDPSRFVSRGIRDHLAGGAGEPEHRLVTIAFVRMQGLDRLIDTRGIDEAGEVLHRFISRAQDSIDAHELCFLGTDVDKNGGKILVTAGAPQSFEDDTERLVAVVRTLQDGEDGITAQIGVNRGRVFAGDIGPSYRRTYSVMGDVVNTAARVMAHAEPGEVLLTAPVARAVATRYGTTPVPPFAVKGKKEPLKAFRLDGDERHQPVVQERSMPLVGRAVELAALLDAARRARAGETVAVDVTGEPGIGKSRLVEELRSRCPDMRSFLLQCDRYESSAAYAPIRRLVRTLLGLPAARADGDEQQRLAAVVAERAPDLVPHLGLVGTLTGVTVPSSFASEDIEQRVWQRRLENTAVRLFAALLREPAIVVVEDAHWLDEASFTLLRAVAHRGRGPVLIALVRRPGGAPIPNATSIAVPPLDEYDAAKLLRHSAGRALLPNAVSSLVARAGGNPLFVTELAAMAGDVAHEDLPETLEGLLASHIDRLAPAARSTLRRLSVLGRAFPLSAIPALIDGDGPRSIEELADYVELRDGWARFRQVLFHDVCYEQLPYRLRRSLHARAGEYIERTARDPGDVAETLSLHFHEARDAVRSWRYSRAAAERAYAQFAFADAVVLYRRALEAARAGSVAADDELASAWLMLGDALRYTGRLDEASECYARARRIARDDPATSARLALLEGGIRRRLGRTTQAIRWYRRGLRLLEGRPLSRSEAKDRVRLMIAYVGVRREEGRHAEAIRLTEQALTEAERNGDGPGMGHACNLLHLLYAQRREPIAEEYAKRALSLFEQAGSVQMQAQVTNNLGMYLRSTGRLQEAVELYTRAREMLRSVGDDIPVAVTTNNIAEIYSDQGRLEEARAAFEEALDVFVAARHGYAYAVKSGLALVAAREARFEDAEALFADARAGLESMRFASLVRELEIRRAQSALLQGLAAEALERAEAVLAGGDTTLEATAQNVAGWAAWQLGDHEAALARLRRALEVARSTHNQLEAAIALCHLARLARARGIRDRVAEREASEILVRLGVVAVDVPPVLAGRPALAATVI